MSEPDKPIQLGLTSEANAIVPLPQVEYIPAPEALQFRKAEHVSEAPTGPPCVICAKPIGETYYHANGQIVCAPCATAVQACQSAPPAHTLLKSFFYGLGAAIAGTALYSLVTIVTGYQLALIAILIGYMVGKSIRYASKGLGGRPQQIVAVVLTYFSITASFIPVFIHAQMEKSKTTQATVQSNQPGQPVELNAKGGVPNSPHASPKVSVGGFVVATVILLGIALAAPFLALSGGLGSLLTLLIIFFGLQRAWVLTGRSHILVMGPYQQGS
jgi:hypothetical protein